MDRYTSKDAEKCAQSLAKALGKQFMGCGGVGSDGKYRAKVGCWVLDNNPTYGGAKIAEIVNEAGGEGEPFGSQRMKSAQFCQATKFAEKALEISRGDK